MVAYSGPGQGQNRNFKIHICHGAIRSCRADDQKDEMAFHPDYLSMLEVKDLAHRKAAWWQTGIAKTDFESFRKRMMDEERARPSDGGPADEGLFDLDAEPDLDELADPEVPPGVRGN